MCFNVNILFLPVDIFLVRFKNHKLHGNTVCTNLWKRGLVDGVRPWFSVCNLIVENFTRRNQTPVVFCYFHNFTNTINYVCGIQINRDWGERKQPIFIFNLWGGGKMVTRFLLANLTRDKKKMGQDTTPKDMSGILSFWSIVTGKIEIKRK